MDIDFSVMIGKLQKPSAAFRADEIGSAQASVNQVEFCDTYPLNLSS